MASPGQRRRLLMNKKSQQGTISRTKGREFKFPIIQNGVVVGTNYFIVGAKKAAKLPFKAVGKIPVPGRRSKQVMKKAARQ